MDAFYYAISWAAGAAVNFWMWLNFKTEVKFVALFTSGVFTGLSAAAFFAWAH